MVVWVYRVFGFVCFWGGYYESCVPLCYTLFNVMAEVPCPKVLQNEHYGFQTYICWQLSLHL